jgi:uncharacterized protein
MAIAVVWLIELYQRTLSPDHGLLRIFFPSGACRHHPTCSEYTKEALKRYGLYRGLQLGVRRVSKCHPFNPGGFDPVPEKK